MNDFKEYYNSRFREDINQFFSTIPDKSKYHEDINDKRVWSIQYERLTPELGHLDFLDKEAKEYFGVALFFTVLADMVCYSYFKPYYDRFNRMTMYPKFIGNCPGGCLYHFHPRDIFFAMNKGRTSNEQHLCFSEKLHEAKEPMREEIISFFNEYMSEVNGVEFWEKCQREFPYRR